MLIKNFGLRVTVRVVLICISIVVLVVAAYVFRWYVTSFCIGLLVLMQVAALINLVEKTNRELARFLSSIKHNDFTQRFVTDDRSGSFKELNFLFNEVIQAFQKIKAEKEVHYLYLQTIIE